MDSLRDEAPKEPLGMEEGGAFRGHGHENLNQDGTSGQNFSQPDCTDHLQKEKGSHFLISCWAVDKCFLTISTHTLASDSWQCPQTGTSVDERQMATPKVESFNPHKHGQHQSSGESEANFFMEHLIWHNIPACHSEQIPWRKSKCLEKSGPSPRWGLTRPSNRKLNPTTTRQK